MPRQARAVAARPTPLPHQKMPGGPPSDEQAGSFEEEEAAAKAELGEAKPQTEKKVLEDKITQLKAQLAAAGPAPARRGPALAGSERPTPGIQTVRQVGCLCCAGAKVKKRGATRGLLY